MVDLSIVASLHIFIGGLGFLVNIVATAFLMNKPAGPMMPQTIYGLSDTISGALTGIALFCDGSLYFVNFVYRNSCYRYFLIYSILVFPTVISNSSSLGVAAEWHQVTAVVIPQPEYLRRIFSLVWTVASWFITLVFIIMLWGHIMVFAVKAKHNNIFYWKNEEIRQNRGLLENLWEHNSQQDWSTDYRENIIIGLIYGIVGGNISHDTLKQFHGVSQSEQIQTMNLKKIKELHTAFGINTEDLQRVFGDKLHENPQNNKEKNNMDIQTEANLTENNKGALLMQTVNFKTFKPSSTEIVKNLTSNSSQHSSKPFQINNVASHADLPLPQKSPTYRPPITVMHLNLRDTNNSEFFLANSSEKNTKISSVTVINSDVNEKDTKTTQIYTQQSTEVYEEGQTYGPETAENENILLTTAALSSDKITNIIPLQGTEFQSSTELYNNSSDTNPNEISPYITNKTDAGISITPKPGNLTKNLSNHSSHKPSRLPLTTTEEDKSTNPPPRTKVTYTACQPEANFLPTYMTVLFILMFAVPLSVSAGLYTHTFWILYCQNPSNSSDLAYLHISHAKRLTCQMMMILLANFACWTPFMIERLLFVLGVLNNASSMVPALLFIFGHIHSLLRGIFYIFYCKKVQLRISAVSTATMRDSGHRSSVILMDEAILNSACQSSSSEENTQIQGNASSAFPVTQDLISSKADNASLDNQGREHTAAKFRPLPNVISHVSFSNNK